MNKIYSATQLSALYRSALGLMALSPGDLTTRAAQGFVELFCQTYRSAQRVHVFAGYSDCGATALAVARLLHDRRYNVSVYLFYQQGTLSESCEEQRQRTSALDIPITEVTTQFAPPRIGGDEIILDGLFGYELPHPLSGGYEALASWINAQSCAVVSIDLPSGLRPEGNSGAEIGKAVRASHTISFESPHLIFLLPEYVEHIGRWQVASLGLPADAHEHTSASYYYQNEQSLARTLLRRPPFTSKEDYGSALLIGGGAGHTGHLLLAARAALSSGLGELSVATTESAQIPLCIAVPEALLCTGGQGAYHVPSQLRGYRAIGLGGAMEAGAMTLDMLRSIFASVRHPLVLDDYAIGLLAEDQSLLAIIPEGSILLLSQSGRRQLLGLHFSHMDYIEAAVRMAEHRDLTLVLKGTYTAICRSSGNVYFNITGNPGMATSGMGDVLMGLILGLLGRGYDSLTAALLGCYLHGTAGDYVAARTSLESLTASSLLAELPVVLRALAD